VKAGLVIVVKPDATETRVKDFRRRAWSAAFELRCPMKKALAEGEPSQGGR